MLREASWVHRRSLSLEAAVRLKKDLVIGSESVGAGRGDTRLNTSRQIEMAAKSDRGHGWRRSVDLG